MDNMKQWTGRPVAAARAVVVTWLPAPCAYCQRPVTPDQRWHVDHHPPRTKLEPELWMDPQYWRPAHGQCNERAGAVLGNKMRGAKRKNVGTGIFLKETAGGPTLSALSVAVSGGPRFLSPSHPNAVGSLWDGLGSWLVDQGLQLRPWQTAVARRAHEVDSAGNLLWRTVCVSTPRQSGKSWLIRAVAMVRGAHPGLFGGEPQEIIHAAALHSAARRIHTRSWSWARRTGLVVRQQLGGERVIWPDGGSWDAMTLSSVYGASAHLILLDEVWGVSPDDYREGLRPTQVARVQPQLWALSTAHRRATSLMPELMAQGREGRARVMLADWGAPRGVPEDDPVMWEAVSPHWDAERAEEMALMVGSPGFGEQWLNVWPDQSDVGRWLPASSTRATVGRIGAAPEAALCGLECSQDGRSWAVAAAWPHASQSVRARVWVVGSAREAMLIIGSRRVWAHPGVVKLAGLANRGHVEPVNVSTSRAATTELRDAVLGGVLTVAGVDDGTWAGVRTVPADGGETIYVPKSVGDAHALKALSWAVWAVQSERNHLGLVL